MKMNLGRLKHLFDDASTGGARSSNRDAPRNRRFLAFFVNWYAGGRSIGTLGAVLTASGAFVAGALCVWLQLWTKFPSTVPHGVRVTGIAVLAAGTFLAAYYRHVGERIRRTAAMTLASALLDTNRECMKLLDLDGRMLRISEHGAKLMDVASPQDITGADWLGFWHGVDSVAAHAAFNGALAGERTAFRGVCQTMRGTAKTWESRLSPIEDENGTVIAVVCASSDVSAQAALIDQLRSKSELMCEMELHMPVVFYSYSANYDHFHYITAGCERLFGLTQKVFQTTPSAWLDLVMPDSVSPVLREMHRIVAEGTDGKVQYWIKRDGEERCLRSTGFPIRDAAGKVLRVVGITQDVTGEQQRIIELDRLAYTDSLTGLANRAALLRDIERRCAAGIPFGLLFVDLDRFKVLNDTLGHVAADHLLRKVGDVIKAALPADAFIARLGGDEFAVLVDSATDRPGFEQIAQTLLAELARTRLEDRTGVYMTASIGISQYPEHGADHEALLSSADVAMYAAKKNGRNGFRFAGKEAAETIGDFELERDLPEALNSNQFLLHFQTIHETGSLCVQGTEALIRWNHPTRGLIPPGVFIPILEETGFVADVGVWVLNSALQQLAAWRRAGAMELGISVNVSARQLGGDMIVRQVERALHKHGIPPGKLEIELTETALMQNPQEARKAIVALKRLGVRIAIDDFGTGYSSLKYLADFAPHTLKIDRHFTSKVAHDAATQSIVEGIVGLSHRLEIKVIAEGVEEEAQLDILRKVNCDYVQGYLLNRPQPAAHLDELIVARDYAGLLTRRD
ncbi:EAL domain-containing protein [Paraburkholderia sp.]|uniref:putative bifunctional diguanylate cyclase/phosphodiesterase n=1 Tax=Paraburkholderia sp. TaxID=1926495 RepID=UPI0023933472|nr:EAL domain-containing protein [Paraburkholderia sp.]MDE1180325.1 EAL domain-containing protein [Paraburkholderia sp.]